MWEGETNWIENTQHHERPTENPVTMNTSLFSWLGTINFELKTYGPGQHDNIQQEQGLETQQVHIYRYAVGRMATVQFGSVIGKSKTKYIYNENWRFPCYLKHNQNKGY